MSQTQGGEWALLSSPPSTATARWSLLPGCSLCFPLWSWIQHGAGIRGGSSMGTAWWPCRRRWPRALVGPSRGVDMLHLLLLEQTRLQWERLLLGGGVPIPVLRIPGGSLCSCDLGTELVVLFARQCDRCPASEAAPLPITHHCCITSRWCRAVLGASPDTPSLCPNALALFSKISFSPSGFCTANAVVNQV